MTTCPWCHGDGVVVLFGVPVTCVCRPFDVAPRDHPDDATAGEEERPTDPAPTSGPWFWT